MSEIRTRLLILSDTHGTAPVHHHDPDLDLAYRHPLPPADVVLHCGDLTKRSTPPEYHTTFSMLRRLDSPLKLVIPGNHDTLLDTTHDEHDESDDELKDDARAVRQIVQDARQDNVHCLQQEGTHRFALRNGATLTLYASPYTPSYGRWAFQYPADHGHVFDIPPGVDVAMTHGPPYGILDEVGLAAHYTTSNNKDDNSTGTPPGGAARRQNKMEHAGCKYLFDAIARAKPRIHCFGHIHEGWGAYYGTWADLGRAGADCRPRRKDAFDASRSRTIHRISELRPVTATTKTRGDTSVPAAAAPDADKVLLELGRQQGAKVDLTDGDTLSESGKQTLFVNAAIMDIQYRPLQFPWIIDLDLAKT